MLKTQVFFLENFEQGLQHKEPNDQYIMLDTNPAATALLTTMEASARLGYQSKTAHSVLRLIKRGELAAVRLNSRTLRIRESVLNEFIQQREGGNVYA